MIILDIDMPTKCMNCSLLGRDSIYCQVYPRKDLNIIEVTNDKPEWCPIKGSIEDIKAEIEALETYEYDDFIRMRAVLDIIDKHISGKENE